MCKYAVGREILEVHSLRKTFFKLDALTLLLRRTVWVKQLIESSVAFLDL